VPLKIGRGDVDHIHEHARESYPEECAGAMVGMSLDGMKIVVDVWRAENTHEDERSRRFLIEPLKIKEFEERAAERDMDVLGFYHSHPGSAPVPSPRDIAEAAYDDALYLIAGIEGQAEVLRVFRIRDGSVEELPLRWES